MHRRDADRHHRLPELRLTRDRSRRLAARARHRRHRRRVPSARRAGRLGQRQPLQRDAGRADPADAGRRHGRPPRGSRRRSRWRGATARRSGCSGPADDTPPWRDPSWRGDEGSAVAGPRSTSAAAPARRPAGELAAGPPAAAHDASVGGMASRWRGWRSLRVWRDGDDRPRAADGGAVRRARRPGDGGCRPRRGRLRDALRGGGAVRAGSACGRGRIEIRPGASLAVGLDAAGGGLAQAVWLGAVRSRPARGPRPPSPIWATSAATIGSSAVPSDGDGAATPDRSSSAAPGGSPAP